LRITHGKRVTSARFLLMSGAGMGYVLMNFALSLAAKFKYIFTGFAWEHIILPSIFLIIKYL
jgi:hypothetical protein